MNKVIFALILLLSIATMLLFFLCSKYATNDTPSSVLVKSPDNGTEILSDADYESLDNSADVKLTLDKIVLPAGEVVSKPMKQDMAR